VIQAFGGMVIAMVVKYADNLLKGFAICLSIILSSLLSVLLLNYQLTIQFGVGAAFVLISIYLYGYQYQPSPPMQEGATGSVVLPK
jgi:UDP-sugar transporter A1/2/3